MVCFVCVILMYIFVNPSVSYTVHVHEWGSKTTSIGGCGLSYHFCRSYDHIHLCKPGLQARYVCGSKTTRREGEVTAWCVGLVMIFVNHFILASYM